MHESLALIISEYDIYKMAEADPQLYQESEDTQLALYLSLYGLVLQQRFTEAAIYYNENKILLNQTISDPYASLLLYCDNQINHDQLIFQTLNSQSILTANNFIQADYLFTVGYSLLLSKNFPLAKVYFVESLELFTGDLYLALKWRSLFSLALTIKKLSYLDYTEFKQTMEIVNKLFNDLPTKAQVILARFRIWQHVEEFEDHKALELLRDCLQKAKFLKLDREYILLQKNLYYLVNKFDLNYKLEKLDLNNTHIDQRCIHEILQLSNKTFADIKAIIEYYKKIEDQFDSMNFIYVVDILSKRLIELNLYSELIKLYKQMSSKYFDNLIVTLFRQEEYLAMAYAHLGYHKKAAHELKLYKLMALPWRYQALAKRVLVINSINNDSHLTINRRKNSIYYNGRTISFNHNEKSIKLILSLKKAPKQSLPLKSLSKIIYGTSEQNTTKTKLLIERITNKLDDDKIIIVSDHHVTLSSLYTYEILNINTRKSRLSEIIKFIESTNQANISLLEKEFAYYSRRSIQNDLSYLIQYGKIMRVGKGRYSTYQVVK